MWRSGCIYKALGLIPALEKNIPGPEQVWELPVAEEQVDAPWDLGNEPNVGLALTQSPWLSVPGEESGTLASG